MTKSSPTDGLWAFKHFTEIFETLPSDKIELRGIFYNKKGAKYSAYVNL
jgi:hypothetical protein